jgi:hypothetical protein
MIPRGRWVLLKFGQAPIVIRKCFLQNRQGSVINNKQIDTISLFVNIPSPIKIVHSPFSNCNLSSKGKHK